MAGVLITGGTGLLGRYAASAFRADGVAVHVVGRDAGDLLQPGAFERLLAEVRPEAVVHLAWTASSTPDYRTHPDNPHWAEFTVAAAQRALELGIAFVGTGTAVDDEADAEDAYARSKQEARRALADAIEHGRLTWLRPFYVFDESVRSPAVLRAALLARERAEAVVLHSPESRHDFVHAADVGTAIRSIVVERLTGPVDIGTGRLLRVRDFVEAFGCRWAPGSAPSSAADNQQPADAAKLRAIGWRPTVSDARLGTAD